MASDFQRHEAAFYLRKQASEMRRQAHSMDVLSDGAKAQLVSMADSFDASADELNPEAKQVTR